MTIRTTSLFRRKYALRVGKAVDPAKTVLGAGKEWSDLRMTFQVERNTRRDPGKAQIELWNPDPVSAEVIERGAVVQLLAGYGQIPALIFSGSISKRGVRWRKDGPDTIVSIEAGDGEELYRNSPYRHHWTAGTPRDLILADILRTMGVGLDPTSIPLPPLVYNTDVTFFGPARKAMDEVVGAAGWEWSFQDGNVLILPPGTPSTDTAPLVTPDTGLIGAPEKTDEGIDLTTLLNPAIRPGRPIQVVSRWVKGWFKVRKLEHQGDSRGSDWYTSLEARPVDF